MDYLKHIIYIDRKEDTILFTEILKEIKAPYQLHCFSNFLNAEEFLQLENNINPDLLLIGSNMIHMFGEARLKEFRKNKRLNKSVLIVLIQGELCRQYLIKTHIPNLQFLIRPFDIRAYKELIKKLLLSSTKDIGSV